MKAHTTAEENQRYPDKYKSLKDINTYCFSTAKEKCK